eukprot:jgi/Mesvir1/21147/Mv14193-RA.1
MLSSGKPRKVGSDALPCHVSSQGDLVARRLPCKGRQLNYILDEKANVLRKAGLHVTCILLFALFVAMPASLLAAMKLKPHILGNKLASLEGVITQIVGDGAQRHAEDLHSGPAVSLNVFSDLSLTIALDQATHDIPDKLYGIFFEEINHAGESGLYGEMVRNRGVEAGGTHMPASIDPWMAVGDVDRVEISSEVSSPHERNPVALRVDVTCVPPVPSDAPKGDEAGQMAQGERGADSSRDEGGGASSLAAVGECSEDVGVANPGFWGMNVVTGARYTLSLWLRVRGLTTLRVSLVGANGSNELATGTLWLPGGACPLDLHPARTTANSTTTSKDGSPPEMVACAPHGSDPRWLKVVLSLLATASDTAALRLTTRSSGTFWMDIVSLFPEPLSTADPFRRDILGAMQGLSPKFMRFPGGCFVEGDSLRNGFRWHETLGAVEERPGHLNDVWGYWSEDGLGLLEYLTLAERLGATPIWVFNMGKSHRDAVLPNAIGPWLRDVLNGIEFARGPATSTWGRVRAKMGRVEPFDLKFVAIGNENCGSYYYENFMAFYRPIHKKWKDITVISNCELGEGKVPPGGDLFDFHVYASPDEIFALHTRFDSHPRGSSRVFVSDDLVVMASYAPLLVNVNDRKWDPDAIIFNSHALYGTPSYWLQHLFHAHVGTTGLRTELAQGQNAGVQPPAAGGGAALKSTEGDVSEEGDVQRLPAAQALRVAFSATATATAGANGGRSSDGVVFVKVVNYEPRAVSMYVSLDGVPATAVGLVAKWMYLTGAPADQNSFDSPHKVYPLSTVVEGDSRGGFLLQLPALSAGVLVVNTTAAPWLPITEEL